MKKTLHKQVIPLVLFVLLWMFILPFTAKSQTVWDGTADISWYNTSQSSFDISTAEQLAGLAQLVNTNTENFGGKTINLIADIWLNADNDSTNNWNSIGGYPGGISGTNEAAGDGGNRYFRGVFNGNFHVINNMYCYRPTHFHAGLFGAVGSMNSSSNVRIQNLIVKNAKIRAKGMAGTLVGFITSGGNAYFDNCMVINTSLIADGGNNNGGMIGATYANTNYTHITNCGVTGEIVGAYPGGMTGNGDRLNVTNSYFAGTVNSKGLAQFGGISAYSGSFTNNGAYSNCPTVSTITESRNGTVLTDTYMKSTDFLHDLKDTIFKMDCGVNGGYPVLEKMNCGVPVLGETNICSGNSTTLTATAWDSYLWSTGDATATITVSPTITTTYTVTGTKGTISTVDTVIVNVQNNIDVVGTTLPNNTATITFPGGLIGSYTVPCSNQASFNITVNANTGYYITKILANGVEVAAFAPEDMKATHTFSHNPATSSKWNIEVKLDNRYKINLSSVVIDDNAVETPINGGTLGLITPWGDNGLVWATYGSDTTIKFKETVKYLLQNVEHSSVTLGKIDSLELNYITSHQTIKATYIDDCAVNDLPFIENFSTYPSGTSAAFPACWNKLSSDPTYPYVVLSGHNDANSMSFYFSSSSAHCMMISPLINEDLSLLRVSFALQSNYSAKFEIGVMTDPTNINSFQLVEDVKYTMSNAYSNYTVYLDKYEGSGKYIAFKFYQGSYAYANVDNIVIDHIPTCKEAQNLTVSNVGGRTALATWQASLDNPSMYEIKVVNDSENTIFSEFTDKLTCTIYGLDTNTNYEVKVRAFCDITESSWISKNIKTAIRTECAVPNLFTVKDITTTSATASWVEDGTSMQYFIEYRKTGTTDWIQEIVYGYMELVELHLTNLEPSSEYAIRIRAFCNNGDSTAWTTLSFRTLCAPFTTLPFVENFDNTPGGSSSNGLVPHCWTINVSNTANKPYVGTQTSPTHSDFVSAFGALDFHYSPNTTNIAVLPLFDLPGIALSDLQVSFMAKARSTSAGIFILGVMDDPSDAGTFISVDTIGPFTSTTTWQEFDVPLTDYKGTGQYIAFLWKNAGNNSVLIDNLYIDLIPECPRPVSIKVDSTTSNTVYFSWVDGVSFMWEGVCVPAGVLPDWNNATSLYENTGAISGLTHNTQYDLYLRSVCGDVSYPIHTSFKTACGVITIDDLPYVESFDTYGTGVAISSFPTCWSRPATATAPYINATAYSSPGAMYFYYTSTLLTAITPEFAMPISSLQMELKLRTTNTSCGLIVGVMTDRANEYTFTPVDTVFGKAANTWENHTVYLNNYAENGQYIAFRAGGFGTSYTVYMDDVIIYEIGTCAAPDEVTVTNVSNDEATISWRENGDATEWDIAYGPNGFDPDNWEGMISFTGTNPAMIGGLAENTLHDVYVRSYCYNGDKSNWSRVICSFYTTQIPTELPYVCDFEDDTENAGWALINGTQTNQWRLGEAVNNGGSKSLYISNANGTTHEYNNSATSYVYALKAFDFSSAGVYELSFDWRANGEQNYDIMRVFLIPGSVRPEAGNAYGMTGSTNTLPKDWIDISGGALYSNDSWTRKKVEFTINAPTVSHVVIFWKNDYMGGDQAPGAIDNIDLRQLPCPSPTSFMVTNINDTEATLSWNERGSATVWEIQYGAKGFTAGNGTPDFADNIPHTLTNLSPDFTWYEAYVRAICGVDDSYWVGPISFRTSQSPTPVPYICDFEDDTENENWGFLNGTQTNKWFIDTAANNTTYGAKSLYISNSNGTTNTYTFGTTSYVYAMRTLNFNATGVYEIEFDWKANGYSSYDLLRAFLVPTTVAIEDGNAFGMTANSNTTPPGWIDIGKGNLNQKTTWQHAYSEITMPNAGNYNLVFFWKNYSMTGGAQTPGAIDNINIRPQTCPPPYALAASDITATDASITWTEFGSATEWEIQYGPSGFTLGTGTPDYVYNTPNYTMTGLSARSWYDVYVRSICGAGDNSAWSTKTTFRTPCVSGITHLPYFENFDTYENGAAIPTSKRDVIPDCWTSRKTTGADNAPYIANWGTGYRKSDYYALDFAYTSNSFSIAIMPEIDAAIVMTDLQLSFWGRAGSSGSGTFSVGVMDDPQVDASFTAIATYSSPATTYQQRTVNLADYTGTGRYIAFKWENGSGNSFMIDDVELTSSTAPACTPPVSLSSSAITGNSASIAWVTGSSETSWSVEYKKASESNYSTPVTVTSTTHNLTNLTANTDYHVRVRAICGGSSSVGVTTQFKTLSSTADTYTITPNAGNNGTIDPSTPVTVSQGASQTFTFAPNSGYEVDVVKVNDAPVTPTTALSYTFTNVQANATIDVTFKTVSPSDSFLIVASCGDYGDISPKGNIKVVKGGSQIFTFTPNQEYMVDSVFVDGIFVASDTSSYTIENVQADMTIHVVFKPDISIPQYLLDNSILIYPNPASKQLVVKLSAAFEQLEITNLLGQVIYTATVTEQEFAINVNDYRSGVYFIRLSGKQGMATKKFIKE